MVATPIGNLEDVTLRALRVLREVDVIAAEDTRRTRVLLRRHGIRGALISYYDAVERRRAPELVARMRAGARVALVSDAGTPGIADPGYHLVRGAIAAGMPVVPIPGASAVTALVSVAGLPVDRFAFEGFLPRPRPRARAARLRGAGGRDAGARLPRGGAPARRPSWPTREAALGDREAVIGRELTKLHEEMLRGRLSGAARARRAPARGARRGHGARDAEHRTIASRCRPARCDDAIRHALAAGPQRARAQRGGCPQPRLLAARGLSPGARAAAAVESAHTSNDTTRPVASSYTPPRTASLPSRTRPAMTGDACFSVRAWISTFARMAASRSFPPGRRPA